jgi:hypothetical protein
MVWIIRPEQMKALRRVRWISFEEEMLLHLTKYFPLDCQLLGSRQIRKVIRHGIERADSHGFTAKGEICRYIDLSLALGSHFDRDPQLPWVAPLLRISEAGDPSTAMSRLQGRAMEHLEHVSGRRGEHYVRALLRARSLTLEERTQVGAAGFEPYLKFLLAYLHPEKFQLLGDAEMNALLALARADAEARGLEGAEALKLHITSMFLLGSYYAEDPLFPWAAEVLGSPSLMDSGKKARALFEQAGAHRERVLGLLREERA